MSRRISVSEQNRIYHKVLKQCNNVMHGEFDKLRGQRSSYFTCFLFALTIYSPYSIKYISLFFFFFPASHIILFLSHIYIAQEHQRHSIFDLPAFPSKGTPAFSTESSFFPSDTQQNSCKMRQLSKHLLKCHVAGQLCSAQA